MRVAHRTPLSVRLARKSTRDRGAGCCTQSFRSAVYGRTAGGYRHAVDLRHVAILVWVLSWLGAVASYGASALAEHVPACVPYLTGCSSISAGGRHGAGFFMFKATILPAAAFWIVYWTLCGHWLRSCGDASGHWRRATVATGVIGALFLVLYTTFLGSDGDFYRSMRRYGTVVFFGCTFLAQLLLAYRVQGALGETWLVRIKMFLCLAVLVEGLALVAVKNFLALEDDDWLENVAEWHTASAISFYPFLTWLMWRRSGWSLEFVTKPRAPGGP